MAQENMQMATSHGDCGDGTAASTPVAVTLALGFRPRYVKVVTIDTTTDTFYTEWIYGMTAAMGMQMKDDTTFKYTELAADGITVSATGFTIGTACQTASKKYHWIALG